MSVLTRIRIVGAIATSIVSALGLFATFWLVSFFDVLPGIQSGLLVGALLTGLPLLAALCVLFALSVDAGLRPEQSNEALELMPAEGGTFDASPVEVGRI